MTTSALTTLASPIKFATNLFTNGDSREPEIAGVLGAVIGSLYTILITLIISFPIGVLAAIYLESFAAKNRITDFIEVNINNLAAVPSIVFGLLGLALFINFFGMPRSAPLVGGCVLSLMTLPVIIITTRASLQSVPPSIREAALAMGASEMQVVFEHLLPAALPGIFTGTIIGIARAFGESAPLLLIGMVAFVVDIPQSVTDPATALPVQVYIWADSPERAFVAKTSAATLVLIFLLIIINFDVDLVINEKEVTSLIGPSGCGKSTFIRCLNRMNDVIETCSINGSIVINGQDIYDPEVDVVELRAKIGMVFQKPNPFPKSVYDNVAYGPKLHGKFLNKSDMNNKVEESLVRAGLWDEIKDRLNEPGTALSGGQQQRLCIARAIAVDPEIILMDEPCSALDPIATARIEELIDDLKVNYTIVIVTHSMQQAARVSQRTAFFHLGNLIEVGDTEKIFRSPENEQTEAYVTGRYG